MRIVQSEPSLQCSSVSFFILIKLLKSHEPHEFSSTCKGKRVNETTCGFEAGEGDNVLLEVEKIILAFFFFLLTLKFSPFVVRVVICTAQGRQLYTSFLAPPPAQLWLYFAGC